MQQEKKVLIEFKTKIFLIKNSDEIPTPEQEPEPTFFATPKPIKERTKKSSSKFYVDVFDKIVIDETNITMK